MHDIILSVTQQTVFSALNRCWISQQELQCLSHSVQLPVGLKLTWVLLFTQHCNPFLIALFLMKFTRLSHSIETNELCCKPRAHIYDVDFTYLPKGYCIHHRRKPAISLLYIYPQTDALDLLKLRYNLWVCTEWRVDELLLCSATDFTLKPSDCPDTDFPVRIAASDKGCLWYKKDNKFKIPKGVCFLQQDVSVKIISPNREVLKPVCSFFPFISLLLQPTSDST